MRPLALLAFVLAPAFAAAQPHIVADGDDARRNAHLVIAGVDALFNHGDFSRMDEAIAQGYVEHEAAAGDTPGSAGLREYITMLRASFPDFRYELDEVVAAGDRVVLRGRMTGTHTGAVFMGIPAGGRHVEVPVMDVLRVADELVTDHWGVTDSMTMMRQLEATTE